jgi:hypothetical protein
MKKFILFALIVSLMVGPALATYTPVSAVKTLDALNDYTFAPAAWTSIATSTNYNNILYDGSYDYIVGVNVTVVGTSPTFNVIAGTNPPAFRAGIGDLEYSLTNNSVQWFGPLESARFLNGTGYYNFGTTNVTTGKIMVLKVAKV